MRFIIFFLAIVVCGQVAYGQAIDGQSERPLQGYRVVEGDMLLPDSAFTSQVPSHLWTNNTIPYVIDSDIPNPSRITGAITWYNQNTPITYQQRASEANFVHYIRSTIGNGICYFEYRDDRW